MSECDRICHRCMKDCIRETPEGELFDTVNCVNRMACFLVDTDDCNRNCPGYEEDV